MASTTMKSTGADTSSTLGNKRLASEELANDWDNRRLNPGNANYPLSTAGSDNLFMGQGAGKNNGQTTYSVYDNGNSMALPSGQVPEQNGVKETGCAPTAAIIITHLVHFVTDAKLRKSLRFIRVRYNNSFACTFAAKFFKWCGVSWFCRS